MFTQRRNVSKVILINGNKSSKKRTLLWKREIIVGSCAAVNAVFSFALARV